MLRSLGLARPTAGQIAPLTTVAPAAQVYVAPPYTCNPAVCTGDAEHTQLWIQLQTLLTQANNVARSILGAAYQAPVTNVVGSIDQSTVDALAAFSASGVSPQLSFYDVKITPQFIADNAPAIIQGLQAWLGVSPPPPPQSGTIAPVQATIPGTDTSQVSPLPPVPTDIVPGPMPQPMPPGEFPMPPQPAGLIDQLKVKIAEMPMWMKLLAGGGALFGLYLLFRRRD